MRFCEALDDLQTVPDFHVRRASWRDGEYLEAPDAMLVKHTPSVGGTADITSVWTPTQEDIFAEDWHEVGEAVAPMRTGMADVMTFKQQHETQWPSSQSHRG